ncbi:MAG: hypothetical protein KGP28_06870 [Bdellovibrionales bacterium]|nr:hypothetical protein [Bdellovibrionales bacterium]
MKFISELICFVFILLAMSASSSVNAVPRTDMDEIYSDDIYMPGFDGDIPSAFESSARNSDEIDTVSSYSPVNETLELDAIQPEVPIHGKKLSARPSRKKSSRN